MKIKSNGQGFVLLAVLFISALCLASAAAGANVVVFSETFDPCPGTWFPDNGIWQCGVPTYGPSGAHSGTNVIGTGLSGNYPDFTTSMIISPSIILPPIDTASSEELHLRYWEWFAIYLWDNGVVYISEQMSPGVWSEWTTIGGNITYSSGVWTNADIDISGYAGKKVRIGFQLQQPSPLNGNLFGVGPGWFIDDVQVIVEQAKSYPYSEDFEGGMGDWGVTNGIWEVGVPTYGPSTCHSGTQCAATVLDGNYPDFTNGFLQSPSIILPSINTSAGEELHLRFWDWFSINIWDVGQVYISEQTSPGVWSEWTTISGNVTGSSAGLWTNADIDISGYAGKKVRIGFLLLQPSPLYGNQSGVGPGWYIDDVQIVGPPAIRIGTPSKALTNTGPVTYTVTYFLATAVTLADTDITLNRTGTANGTVNVTGSGTSTRTVTISNIAGDGTLGISIDAGTATNYLGSAPAAGPSATFTVDNTPPTVSIGSRSAAVTNVGPVTYTVTYTGADAVALANANITLNKTGTANGTVNVTGSGTSTRTVTISGITGDGTLGISVAAGTATDLAGNNAPAAGPSATFTVDNTPPTVSIGSRSAAVTNVGPVTYTVTYTGANAVTLANANVTLNKTGTANGTVNVTGSGTGTRTVTISGITGDGTLGISVAAGTATDLAGNNAPAAGPSETFNVDNTPPALAEIAVVPTPTNNHNPLYTFGSSEAGIVHFGGSCGSATTAAINGSNTITLTAYGGGPFSEGAYANCAVSVTDAAGNASSPLAINAFAVQECQYEPVLILERLLYYTSVNTAYGDATGQETVALYATDFNENLLFSQDKYVTLKGGFDCSYLGNSGHSNIRGTLIISAGTLEIENLVLMASSAP